MRLLKSRAKALLESHLERQRIDPMWWSNVRAAIAYCEAKNWFELVPSAAGPVPARTVVALFKLEPFVRGSVDWDAHANPFLNELTMRSFFDERLGKSIGRWEEVYDSLVPEGDVRDALLLHRGVAADASQTGSLSDQGLAVVYSIGWAGYCWRVAEEQAHGPPREHYKTALRTMWDAFPEDPPRDGVPRNRLLFWGANEVARTAQPHMKPAADVDFQLWQGCPGGNRLVDFDYFKAGLDHAREVLEPEDAAIATPDLWFAWCFGVGLRDFERFLDHAPYQP